MLETLFDAGVTSVASYLSFFSVQLLLGIPHIRQRARQTIHQTYLFELREASTWEFSWRLMLYALHLRFSAE